MPYLRKIPLTGEALERYHFNRLQIRLEEHIRRIEGNDAAYLYDDDDADYDDEDDDHNEHENDNDNNNDNDKTVGYLSDNILNEVLIGNHCAPDELLLERDPVSTTKRQHPDHDVHEQRNGITRRSEERNSHDIVSCVHMKKRSKKHHDHDHYRKCQPKELPLCDVTKLRPDITIPGPLNCDSPDEHKEEDTSLYLTPTLATIDATFTQGLGMNPSICNNHTDDTRSCTKNTRTVSVPRSKRLSFDARNKDELINNYEDRQHVRPNKKGSIQILAQERSFYSQLKQCKAGYGHGHCDVSTTTGEFKSLAECCRIVRTSRDAMEGHLKGSSTPPIKLSEEKVQQLTTESGSNWMGPDQKKRKRTFSERVEDLRQYKAKYGHCDVSSSIGEFKALADWCSKVRLSRKRMVGYLKGTTRTIKLSEENVWQLTELGFNWMGRPAVRKTFSERVEDLRQYKAKYGHCDVSINGEFKALADWCSKVRRCRDIMEGRLKRSSTPQIKLSEEKVQQLTMLGFNWMRPKQQIRRKTFSERVEDLRQYKAKYGNCDVSSIGEFRSLADWCGKVRRSKNFMEGYLKGSSTRTIKLSEERVRQLTELGFN